jgi:hypothetical protein
MTTMTAETVGTLDHPAQNILVDTEYDVIPAEGPLQYWRVAYDRLERHSNYMGDFRPSRVTVRRVERNGTTSSNVEVTFRDDRGRAQSTWVHHSFLVPVGSLPVAGEVTIDQKVEWVTQFMWQSINDDEWGSSGTPSEWDEDEATAWATAGNRAVLLRRAEIESGSISAGRVWCEATDGFHYEQDTMDFLHQWFVDNRAAIDRGLASLSPEPTVAEPERPFEYGDLAVMDGRFVRVIRVDAEARTARIFWYASENGRSAQYTEDENVPWSRLTWAEPGVQRVRRKAAIMSGYSGGGLAAGQEVVLDRVYSPTDRAIYVRLPEGGTTYMCQNDFEPVMPEVRRWDTGRVLRTKQAVYMEGNVLGLCLAEDNHDEARNHPDEIKVYTRENSRWVDRFYPKEQVHFAVEGDNLVHTDGTTATFVENVSDPDIRVRLANGAETRWPRENVRYTGNPATPAPAKPNPVIVIDGIEYVRKDVIDADVETMKSTLHKGSVEHSLCGVYDRVTAQSDARTDYLKLGQRYRSYDVVVEQNVVIRRTIRVEQVTDEDTARTNAVRIATDYPPRVVEAPRRGEAAPQIRSYAITDHRGTATVVG